MERLLLGVAATVIWIIPVVVYAYVAFIVGCVAPHIASSFATGVAMVLLWPLWLIRQLLVGGWRLLIKGEW